MLTKSDKELLALIIERIWAWIKSKTASSSSNGMMSRIDKQRLDYLWQRYGNAAADEQFNNSIEEGGEYEGGGVVRP